MERIPTAPPLFTPSTVHANYQIAGFNLNAGLRELSQSCRNFRKFSPTRQNETSDSSNNGFNFGASHKLPWYGSFTANYNHSYFDSEYADTTYSGAVDTVNAAATFHPLDKLESRSVQLTTRTTCWVVFTRTSSPPAASCSRTLPARPRLRLMWSGYGSYKFADHLFALANVNYHPAELPGQQLQRHDSYWIGNLLETSCWGGQSSVPRSVFPGMTDSTTNQGNTGLHGPGNYSRQFGGWTVNGSG